MIAIKGVRSVRYQSAKSRVFGSWCSQRNFAERKGRAQSIDIPPARPICRAGVSSSALGQQRNAIWATTNAPNTNNCQLVDFRHWRQVARSDQAAAQTQAQRINPINTPGHRSSRPSETTAARTPAPSAGSVASDWSGVPHTRPSLLAAKRPRIQRIANIAPANSRLPRNMGMPTVRTCKEQAADRLWRELVLVRAPLSSQGQFGT